MSEKSKPIFWVDFMRTLSIVLVVVIHSAGPLMYKWGDISPADWMAANFFESFSRASVPMLFMVSGYLLLNRQENIAEFFAKRFRKVFLPFLAWSVFYLVWQNGYQTYTFFNAIKAIVYAIITGPASYHLWFLYELLTIYLFVPILRRFVHSAENAHLWYFAALWLVFGPLQKMVENAAGFEIAVKLGFFTEYIGYFLIGYLLGRVSISTRTAWLSAVVFVAAGSYTMFATYNLSNQAGDYVSYYQWYLTLNAAVASISAFILFRKIGEAIQNERFGMWLRRFAQASFGIYLIHVFFLIVLKRMGFDAFSGPAYISVPALSLTVTLISWLVIAIIQKIPILKEVAPR